MLPRVSSCQYPALWFTLNLISRYNALHPPTAHLTQLEVDSPALGLNTDSGCSFISPYLPLICPQVHFLPSTLLSSSLSLFCPFFPADQRPQTPSLVPALTVLLARELEQCGRVNMKQLDQSMDFLNTPAVIPVDQEYGSRSFDTDDEDGTSAFSVTSSVYNFRVENGRRYHDYKDGHPFPHDQVSEENEVCMHEMCLSLLDDKFYVSPIDESQLRNVADVGTGMGLWAEGMAEKYPDTEVVGIDLTPHERPTHPNCSYIISDATDEWVLDDPSTKFDLVHIRSLFVGVKDWPALYKQCFE